MDIQKHIWGIWGYGIGGKSLVTFLRKNDAQVLVYDKRELNEYERAELSAFGCTLCTSLEDFFAQSTCIIPSAGVNIRAYPNMLHKIITELDFFAHFFKKPIIAITGTLGKTTVTTLLAHMLERAAKRVLVGGNIGVGLCSLIDHQDVADYAVLEVSSFQLEHCRTFVPTVAVWTNFFPNHLDRHASREEYFVAKTQILVRQAGEAISLVPEDVLETLKLHALYTHHWVPITQDVPAELVPFIAHQPGIAVNWQVVAQTLVALSIDLEVLREPYICAIEHRVELVRVLKDISFYNDSKATVAQATLAAVNRFDSHKLVLLIGGLSKGVNREPLVHSLVNKVKLVICFGAEAEQLARWCEENAICYKKADQLAQAVKIGYAISEPGDVVLLSPAGSSFDLFSNYQERGRVFRQLVNALEG